MIRAAADTHTVGWYLSGNAQLSLPARAAIDAAHIQGDYIAISAITFAEIVYLMEKGRLDAATLHRVLTALDIPNGVFVEAPLDRHIAQAMAQVDRRQVPDLPDRIIAATAVHFGVPVITRDGDIQRSSVPTIW